MEVKCTEPSSPSVSLPCQKFWAFLTRLPLCLQLGKCPTCIYQLFFASMMKQGILPEREEVRLTSLHLLIQISCFSTTYLNKEVNRTEPSPSVSVPWLKLSQGHFLKVSFARCRRRCDNLPNENWPNDSWSKQSSDTLLIFCNRSWSKIHICLWDHNDQWRMFQCLN